MSETAPNETWRELAQVNRTYSGHYHQVNQDILSNYPFSLHIQFKLLDEIHEKEYGGRFVGVRPDSKQLLFLGNQVQPPILLTNEQLLKHGATELIFVNDQQNLVRLAASYELMLQDEIHSLLKERTTDDDDDGSLLDIEKVILMFQQHSGDSLFSGQAVDSSAGSALAILVTIEQSIEQEKAAKLYQSGMSLSAMTERLDKPVEELVRVDPLPTLVNQLNVQDLLNDEFNICTGIEREELQFVADPRGFNLLNKLITFCHATIEEAKVGSRDTPEIEKQLVLASKKVLNSLLGPGSLVEVSTYHRSVNFLMATDYKSESENAKWTGPELQQTRDSMQRGNIIYIDDCTNAKSIFKAHAYYYNDKNYTPEDCRRDVTNKVKALVYYNQKHSENPTQNYANVPFSSFGAIIGHIHATNVKPSQIFFLNAVRKILTTAYEASKSLQHLEAREFIEPEAISYAGLRLVSNKPTFAHLEEGARFRARFIFPVLNNDLFAIDVQVIRRQAEQSRRKATRLDLAWELNQHARSVLTEFTELKAV